MGAKDSKPSFISYEDAVKRVSDSELRRIREAFKRCAGANGTSLSLEAFVHDVLCDGVPFEVAEWLYQACGGTKRGIAFKDLFCGIVVLTKGNIEEKIKFLWTLYVSNQGDNGSYIYKRDFARALHIENTSLPVTGAQRTAEILLSLFGAGEKVAFEQFRSWLLIHKDATVLSKWLLSNRPHSPQDLETPTFYQSLAGVTHLEERDIIELEKYFWSLRNSAPTGQLDEESLNPLLSPPLPPAAVAGAFLAFDENRDGHIDFKELCCGLSAACRGPRTERLKFCFKIFDLDRDGVLNKKELIDMVGILCTVANENLKNQSSRASTPSDGEPEGIEKGFDPEVILVNLREKLVMVPKNGRKPVFQLGPNPTADDIGALKEDQEAADEGLIANDLALTLEDFLIWSVESAELLVTPFLDLVFEVCHIVLGLRPQCKHQERDIVLGWLRRAVARGYAVGQFWYLVGSDWWAAWLAHAARAHEPCCRHEPRALDDAILCDDSFTTNSTESMGSLLWRAETASLGSASSAASGGSSSGVSSAAPRAPHPGPVRNARLLAHDPLKVRTLTGEGGHLRRDVTLAHGRDFELLPDALWRAVALWYGAPDPLPRQVIRPPNSDVELELYPLQLKIYRHVANAQKPSGAALYGSGPVPQPERQLAYTAAFSSLATVKQVTEFLCGALGLAREDVRLWLLEGAGGAAELLDEDVALRALALPSRARVLLEVRSADLTWPEELGALAGGRRDTLAAPALPGATGLHNLGNTCFMNAALQAVWNTSPLTKYFNSGLHLQEVNTTNPLGTKGVLALRFGELCKEVWSLGARSVAPLRVRWCVARHARGLAGGGQHDAQELLAWLLDALHEDLNRAMPPAAPPPAHCDSAGRPDQVVAAEAWAQFSARNNSIMTELFYGQLKSKVQCDTCGHESVRFDTFNMLSLPLPMESYLRYELKVILLDGSLPIKYGVRVNSEGTYLDLKKALSELCGLPPEALVLAELAGARLARVMEDQARLGPAAPALLAYERPPAPPAHAAPPAHPATHDWSREQSAWAEVSVARGGNTSSLCMPALFCFKRSRSEILMSQSPPNTFYGNQDSAVLTDHPSGDYRNSTLPRNLKKETSSPTLSVKSLTLKPTSPRLAKVKFGSSPSNMCRMDELRSNPVPKEDITYLVAVHRKQCRSELYFLPRQRAAPALFGAPLLVGVAPALSGRRLHARVWAQVARLLSARPPKPRLRNHAADCDDSLGYEFPFTLRAVCPSGMWCAVCPWPALCRGCALPADDAPLIFGCSGATGEQDPEEQLQSDVHVDGRLRRLVLGGARRVQLAVDWEPTALHLRYQSAREQACAEHASVGRLRAGAARAVDLASCLRAFTAPERLEQRYHCAACRSKQPATKKLQIWRLPPVLIIHLKRFQYVNNKWIKSQKVVNFPMHDFDPTPYLASVPQETILRHNEVDDRRGASAPSDDPAPVDDPAHDADSDDDGDDRSPHGEPRHHPKAARRRLQSSSLEQAPAADHDYHQHRLQPHCDPFHLKYSLYAVVSHSGQLHGGHYVAYARGSGGWLCYNDSACRLLGREPALDAAAGYLLFYQRAALDDAAYLPAPAAPAPAPPALDRDAGCVLA